MPRPKTVMLRVEATFEVEVDVPEEGDYEEAYDAVTEAAMDKVWDSVTQRRGLELEVDGSIDWCDLNEEDFEDEDGEA